MKIRQLELQNFRNYERLVLEPDPKTTVFYGKNAQGKTNLLEAVALCATSRSPRSAKIAEMIRFGQEEAHVRAVIEKENREFRLDLHLKKNGKKGIAVNGVPLKRAAEMIGLFRVVYFSPEEMALVKSGPSARRRFMDIRLCQSDSIYLSDLTVYQKALDQRNKLLKDIDDGRATDETLEIWDHQLAVYGSRVIERRRAFIKALAPAASEIHSRISGGTEALSLVYEPQTEEAFLADSLAAAKERDIRTRATGNGPHRDDIRFSVNQTDIRRYGSQGQQRTAALSVKMAELAMMKENGNDLPVLILDDVLSELDTSRQRDLLENIRGAQTLISCTGLDELIRNRFSIDRLFHIEAGTAILAEEE